MGMPVAIKCLCKVLGLLLMVALFAVVIFYLVYVRVSDPQGYYQEDPKAPGNPTSRATSQIQLPHTSNFEQDKQILFGDTHVHTTWSLDAFMFSLPIMYGSKGAYPPAAACDYARYISQLDFFFLTDHAESYTAERWRDAQDAIRRCNAIAGDPDNPDMVAFIGYEWSQFGNTADEHFGHHNVLFRDTDQALLPTRPIGAAGAASNGLRGNSGKNGLGALQWLDISNRSYYQALNSFRSELSQVPDCPVGISSPELPANCYESVSNPGKLYNKLDEWGFDTLVVPHGSAWGIYTPPGATWEHQLKAEYHDPDKARLIEVYSGHGNSENYRNFQPRAVDAAGAPFCPEPQANYLPGCWQAGNIIYQRCLNSILSSSDANARNSNDNNNSLAECDARAAQARQHFVEADHVGGWLSVPGATAEDWLDAGQARDVFLPAFNYRPKKSVQYGLALRNFDDPENPLSFKWGLVGSTDTHFARPGNGFKQYPRIGTGDAAMRGGRTPFWDWLLYRRQQQEPTNDSRSVLSLEGDTSIWASEQERKMSFLTAGGVVAVHADGRNRSSIWDALKRREVYGTSGHRLLLWFDLINAGEQPQPMGSEVSMNEAPTFRVTAMGSFKQIPGCPKDVKQTLSEKRLEKLAQGECYNPSDERYLIDRIEVIRVRPQSFKDEPVDELIEDLWRVFECSPDPAGCTVEFSDTDFVTSGRDAIYYVRAIEEPSPTINGDNLRAERDASGSVVSVNPCYGDYRIGRDDHCQALKGQRAWSSPIFVNISKEGLLP